MNASPLWAASRESVSDGSLTCVFAICPIGEPAMLGPLTGHDRGGPLELLDLGDSMGAVTQEVPALLFAEEALRRRLADEVELEACVRAHHAVVTAVAAAGPVVPLPLATLFTDAGRARAALSERQHHFRAVLDRVRGCAEWAVKVHTSPRGLSTSAEDGGSPPAQAAASGRAYLTRVRARELDRHARQNAALTSAARVHEAVSGIALGSVRRRPHGTEITGSGRLQVMNAAYLVEDTRASELASLIAALRDDPVDGLDIEATGPWAPYSFTGGAGT